MRLLPWEYAVRNLARSPLRLALSVGGNVLVVALLLVALSFIRGLNRSLAVDVNPDNVILLGAGSEESIERSEVDNRTDALVAGSVPGIKSRFGTDYVSPQVHMALAVATEAGGQQRLALTRGVTDAAFLVHPRVRIVEGRPPSPGEDEVMVGHLAATKLGLPDERLAVGETLWFDDRPWTISGRFEAPGAVMESEIWFQLRDLQVATRREGLSCVVLTMEDAAGGGFAEVDAFCKKRLDLELVAIPESDYYGALTAFYGPVRTLILVTAALIALGGIFGGLNTMYAAFAARVRELGTLQCLGYGRGAIALSLVQESSLAAATGALAAAVIGVLGLDGLAVRFSMGAFSLHVDAPVIATALAAGLVLGVIGALVPAWRCLRMPVTEALRAA